MNPIQSNCSTLPFHTSTAGRPLAAPKQGDGPGCAESQAAAAEGGGGRCGARQRAAGAGRQRVGQPDTVREQAKGEAKGGSLTLQSITPCTRTGRTCCTPTRWSRTTARAWRWGTRPRCSGRAGSTASSRRPWHRGQRRRGRRRRRRPRAIEEKRGEKRRGERTGGWGSGWRGGGENGTACIMCKMCNKKRVDKQGCVCTT